MIRETFSALSINFSSPYMSSSNILLVKSVLSFILDSMVLSLKFSFGFSLLYKQYVVYFVIVIVELFVTKSF